MRQVFEDLEALRDDRVALLPLMFAMKPSPHASCSFLGSYRPCATGGQAPRASVIPRPRLSSTVGILERGSAKPARPRTGREACSHEPRSETF
jgi:hypothetical protein